MYFTDLMREAVDAAGQNYQIFFHQIVEFVSFEFSVSIEQLLDHSRVYELVLVWRLDHI